MERRQRQGKARLAPIVLLPLLVAALMGSGNGDATHPGNPASGLPACTHALGTPEAPLAMLQATAAPQAEKTCTNAPEPSDSHEPSGSAEPSETASPRPSGTPTKNPPAPKYALGIRWQNLSEGITYQWSVRPGPQKGGPQNDSRPTAYYDSQKPFYQPIVAGPGSHVYIFVRPKVMSGSGPKTARLKCLVYQITTQGKRSLQTVIYAQERRNTSGPVICDYTIR